MKRILEEPYDLPPKKFIRLEDGTGISVKTDEELVLPEYSNQHEILSSLP
jgi:hypothetical protein